MDEPTMTLRAYLIMAATVQTGCGLFTAIEAVASTAIEHPEWDLSERDTFAQWQKQFPFHSVFPLGNRPPV